MATAIGIVDELQTYSDELSARKFIAYYSNASYEKQKTTRRVVNNWNSLPQYAVKAPSHNSFKKRMNDYYKDMSLH